MRDWDREGLELMEQNAPECVYYQNYKMVQSGQTRFYYNAGCSCGWRHRKRNGDLWYRVSDEDAVTDWYAHSSGLRDWDKESWG